MTKETNTRPESRTDSVKAVDSEARVRLMLRATNGGRTIMAYPYVDVRRTMGYGHGDPGFDVQCMGTNSDARKEYGAHIAITNGKLKITPFSSGFQGFDADTYRTACEAVPDGDGAFSLKPKDGDMPVDIIITREGVGVGDVFVRFASLPGPVEKLKRNA
ncbi:MAG: hypothetical protein M1160_01080 [Candidatus Marsarchaeota archaeon]|nr:hypothetical protein [Candidatus Marsarchaeota archaeon]MCL5111460.1 hypothetical protein [Candidatus Marsarchaeota archaeon]